MIIKTFVMMTNATVIMLYCVSVVILDYDEMILWLSQNEFVMMTIAIVIMLYCVSVVSFANDDCFRNNM